MRDKAGFAFATCSGLGQSGYDRGTSITLLQQMLGNLPCSLAIVLDNAGKVLLGRSSIEENDWNSRIATLLCELGRESRGHEKQCIDSVFQQVFDVHVRGCMALDSKNKYVFACS